MGKQVVVHVTMDVPIEARNRFLADVNAIMHIDDVPTPFFRSAAGDQPAFIQILAELLKWTLPLKIAASAFLAQVAKRAADDVWDRKKAIAAALQTATVGPLRALAVAIDKARMASDRNPGIVVGLPTPDSYFGTAIHFRPEDEGDIAWFVAHFVEKVDRIDAAVREETAKGLAPLGRAQLHLQTDGAFLLKWTDRDLMKEHERRIE